jgi:hypothetical protein
MDRLWNSTRAVTRAAGRLTGGATPEARGHVALREVGSRRFLRARGDDVGLSEEVDVLRATCRFALYEKRAHLLGLLSPVSGRWLGLTFAGAIACRASRFGSWEEWDLDLSAKGRRASPLLCLGANWGAGCWVALHDRDRRRLVVGPPAADLRAPRATFEVLFLDATHAAPSFAEERLARVGAAAPDHGAEGFLCPECRFKAASPEALEAHYARDHPPPG